MLIFFLRLININKVYFLKPYFQVLNLSRKSMRTNPNLITLLKIASTISLKVTNSTNLIFNQPPWERVTRQ